MPRNAETERPRIVAKVRAYLERANADASLGLTQEDIASGAKVAKRHFSRRDHPDFVALADEIAAARRARTPTPPPPEQPAAAPAATAERPAPSGAGRPTMDELRVEVAPAPGADTLSEAELAMRLRHLDGETRRILQVFLGHHRGACTPSDAPLMLHDLDKALGGLRRQAESLRPLVAEIQRRERAAALSAAGLAEARSSDQVPLL